MPVSMGEEKRTHHHGLYTTFMGTITNSTMELQVSALQSRAVVVGGREGCLVG